MFDRIVTRLNNEEGHGEPWIGILLAVAGAIALGIGAAGDDLGWLAIVGGIVLALGIAGAFGINHATVEKGMYGRLDKLDGNK